MQCGAVQGFLKRGGGRAGEGGGGLSPGNVGEKVGPRVGANVVGARVGGLVSPTLVGAGVGAAHAP